MRNRSLALCALTLTLWIPAAAIEPTDDWRKPWEVTLSADPASRVPDQLTVSIRNHGTAALVGRNLVFSLYRDGQEIFGWAVDPALRAERLEIPPGGELKRVCRFRELKFSTIRGEELPAQKAVEALAIGRWTIVATIHDEASEIPPTESNLTVWSNDLGFGAHAPK